MIRRWLSLITLRAALRGIGRLLRVAVVAALLIAAAPATLVAAIGVALAWLRGWPPGRLYRAALWCLPMVAVWLAATALATHSASAVACAPYHAWLSLWHGAHPGSPAAAAAIAPVAIPVGLAAGGLAWAYRIRAMRTGIAGLSPDAAVSFDARQWRRQARSARARIAAPGAVPLTTRNGSLVAGAVIRTVNHRGGAIASIPYPRMRSHQVVIGTTGTGKTTLLLRLWAGFMATALRRHAAGQGRLPLLVVLDCKGGADARRIADRARRAMRLAGARSTAIWPDEATLSLWDLPPAQLTTTLVDLIEHGTGAAAFYADVMEAVVALAVEAPGGPPASAAEFLARLDPGWLTIAYSSGEHETELALIRPAARQIGDIALRYRTLLRRLGGGLDGPGGFGDADAWYCILEGTAEVSVAETQARAIVDILASYAVAGHQDREILLAVDEFSAVSRRLPVWQLYERARSLGLAVQVSAQSWEGLAAGEDERYRIAATADGGIWLLRTPHPEPVAALAGARKVTETTRHIAGRPAVWSHRGTSRVALDPVVDPALIRALDVGQAAYIFRGGVTYIQVKRLVTAPAAVGRAAAGPGPAEPATVPWAVPQRAVLQRVAATPRRAAQRLPDVSSLLDDAFGAEPAP
jgi:hypothetical protein